MLERVRGLIRRLDMIPRGSKVLCAVSGGADSVCLLMVLYKLREKLDFTLAAAHYNHGLRGAQAQRDEDFVRQFITLCCGPEQRSDGSPLPGVELYVGRGDVAARAREKKTGLEETAREMRYEFLRRTARDIGADRIATAHTANDNAETILLHLGRGTGLRGLTGIRPVREELIRPLLTTTREQVESWLGENCLPHVEDSSNADESFARNRIRRQVIPVLEELYPGFAPRLSDMGLRLAEEDECLSHMARALLEQGEGLEDGMTVSAALLAQAPRPVAVRCIRMMLARLNDGDDSCTASHLEGVLALTRGEDPSAQTDLPRGLVARREYDRLVITAALPPPPPPEQALPVTGGMTWGRWHIGCEGEIYKGQPWGAYEFWLRREETPRLSVRDRRVGDELKLPNRPGKSVKKWMVEEKIPRHIRPLLPVFTTGSHTAAVAGLGPDSRFLPQPGDTCWHITVRELSGKESES